MVAPVRVLQLATGGPLYGAERWILALMRNHEPGRVHSSVAVIADEPGAPLALLDEARKLGFDAHAIDAPGRFDRAAVGKLRALIERESIDVVHSHGYKADLLALLAVRGMRVRTVATPHGWSKDGGIKLRGYEWLDRQLFRWFDAVAPLSPDLELGLHSMRSLRPLLHTITNGVDLLEVDAVGEIPSDLALLRQRGPVIGYAGRLVAQKDVATLVRAVAAWERPDASLVILGEGNLGPDLHALAGALGIGGRTHFMGFRADRLAWMRGFDVFVLPSRIEGIPRCLMEAMALRVPVVASDIPGTRELVRHGETGLQFVPGDVEGLRACLEATSDEAGWARRTTAARERIESTFSARAMAAGYEKLFGELVSR